MYGNIKAHVRARLLRVATNIQTGPSPDVSQMEPEMGGGGVQPVFLKYLCIIGPD